MKIYTKTGDSGTTSLFGGKRVDKNSLRINAYGTVDELNSLLGVIITETYSNFVRKKLTRIQEELMVLAADLSSPVDLRINIPRVTNVFITRLEREVDAWEDQLPKLKNFILPGGSKTAANIHLARAIARRTERAIVATSKEEKINKFALMYINRLSDWLFVLARYVNIREENGQEIVWKGRSSKA